MEKRDGRGEVESIKRKNWGNGRRRGRKEEEENDKGRRLERKENPRNKQVEQLGIGMHA